MKSLRLLWLSAPLVLAAGCLLPSFETVEGSGSGGSAGSGGTTSGSGGTGGSTAGTGGQDDSGGEGGGGADIPLVVTDDEYVVRQGEELTRIATQGFLANDDGEGLSVTDVTKDNPDLPSTYDGELEVEPDGSFSFVPADDFIGAFHATYEVTDGAGNTASANVTIYVQPVAVDVAVLVDGVGGFCVSADSGESIGNAIAGVGDTDGDDLDDFAVGAPGANTDDGRLYVVRGAERGESFLLEDPSSSEERFFALDGAADSRLGASVAWAGDLDDDGLDDLVIGAPGASLGDDGRTHVVTSASSPPPQVDVADVEAFSAVGGQSDELGRAVAGGFDLSGDGVPDPLTVGAFPISYRGRYYVLDGSSSVSLALPGDAEAAVAGAGDDDFESHAVVSVGDVDGDGENDLLLAAASIIGLVRGPATNFPADLSTGSFTQDTHGWTYERTNTSAGPAGVAGGQDVDGDGEPDIVYCDGDEFCRVVFGPIDGLDQGLTIQLSGTIALVAMSDIDGDGVAELAFTDGFDVFVVYGGSTAKSGSDQLGDLTDDDGFVLSGSGAIASLASVGDVNGDGYGDLAFGMPLAASGDGQVCVLYGTPKAD